MYIVLPTSRETRTREQFGIKWNDESSNDFKDSNVGQQIMLYPLVSSPSVSSSILVVHDLDISRRDCKCGPSIFTSYITSRSIYGIVTTLYKMTNLYLSR